MSGQAGGAAHLVIGMGLNLNMDVASEVDQPWANLVQTFATKMPHRNQIVIALIEAWKSILERYEQQGMTGFVERWNQLDNFFDKPVKLIMGNKEVHGIDKGIDQYGGIRLQTEQGLETFIGGEISLRKAE